MKRNLIINQTLRDLNNFKKIIREAYGDIANDEQMQDPRMMQQGYGDEEMVDDEQMPQEQQPQEVDPKKMSNHERMEHSMNGDEMQEQDENAEIKSDGQMRNIIDQIRELAIQGIAQYSDNIEDMRYQSLKRIWMETDKFYESFISDDKKKK